MPRPKFSDFEAAWRGCAPTAPERRPFCEPTTRRCEPRFSTQPPPVLSGISGPGGQIGAGKPRNVVREGLGWGFRMLTCSVLLTDACFCSLMPFLFCNGILIRPADFYSNTLLKCFCRGCFFGLVQGVQGTLTPSAPTVGFDPRVPTSAVHP